MSSVNPFEEDGLEEDAELYAARVGPKVQRHFQFLRYPVLRRPERRARTV
jgi:hypothetical protein